MKFRSGCQEPQIMPRWLSVAYRFSTAFVLLMVIAALVSLMASVLLGIDSLWNWGILRITELRNLFAST